MDKIELYVDDNHLQINDNVQYMHLTQVQTLENASCMEIDVCSCLDYALERDQILTILINKLRYEGVLKISGVDLNEVIYNYSVGKLSIQQLQQFLYAGRLSADSYENIIQKLKQAQLIIIHSNISDNQYFITAKRELLDS